MEMILIYPLLFLPIMIRSTNEIQDISTDGNAGNISISNGSTITLNVDDADNDPTNELYDDTQVQADIATNTANIATNATDIADHIANDLDTDPTNEIQTLTSNDGSVSVTPNGNDFDLSITIPANNDNDPTNEFQDISTDGNAGNISISNGSTITP